MTYQFFHLKDRRSSSVEGLIEEVQAQNDANTWGIFPPLFGLGTNELYWVVMTENPQCPIHAEGVEVIAQTTLQATIRPTIHQPRERRGVYVFRWFEVSTDHIPEVVRLSGQAWETFEDGFDMEVQGLFTATPAMPVGSIKCAMLLLTWYPDLAVWQDSRKPDPAAAARFRERQALLDSAVPIATRLVLPAK